jgi:hypothetical protein
VSVPAIPTPLDSLRHCPFSFYPPIRNVEHNEWLYRRANWNEIQVMNTKTHAELAVPRQFVGEISLIGEPVMIVGLLKELEYKEGVVVPHLRRVIEMPRAVNDWPRSFSHDFSSEDAPRHGPAEVVGIRVESPKESRATRMVIGTLAAGLLACVTIAMAFRDVTPWVRSSMLRSQVDLPFTPHDDYASVVRKLGNPANDANDQWRSSGGVSYRRLWYPRHAFAVILIGDHYAGVIDARGHILHSPEPALLRNLQ